MKSTIVSIAEREETAKVLNRYLLAVFADHVDSFFMTYHRTLLSGTLIRQTDLFIVELFETDNVGPRAEGIFAAEKLISLGKRTIIVSGAACSESIRSPLYWDLGDPEELKDRILAAIETPLSHASDLNPVKAHFRRYCRPPEDPHQLRM
jgi:hypothetical protein